MIWRFFRNLLPSQHSPTAKDESFFHDKVNYNGAHCVKNIHSLATLSVQVPTWRKKETIFLMKISFWLFRTSIKTLFGVHAEIIQFLQTSGGNRAYFHRKSKRRKKILLFQQSSCFQIGDGRVQKWRELTDHSESGGRSLGFYKIIWF